MLTVWAPGTDGQPEQLADGLAGLAPGQLPLWIDLYQPDAAEEQAVETLLGIDVPTAADRRAMEDSAQFYSDADTLFLTCAVMGRRTDGPFSSEPVTFILTPSTLVTVRTRLGGALEQADGLADRLADERTAAQATRSAAEDVDMAQAVSDFQMRQTSYDAALRTYSMVQRLSLFEYIR